MDLPDYESNFDHPIFCDEHPDNELVHLCTQCDIPICVTCIGAQHFFHEHQDISFVASKFRSQLKSSISSLEKASDELNMRLLMLPEMVDEIREKSENNDARIKKKCKDIRDLLDLYEAQLLAENKKQTDSVVAAVEDQLNEATCLSSQLTFLKEHQEKMYEIGSLIDVAASGNRLLAKAESLLAESKDSSAKQRARDRRVEFIPCLSEKLDRSKIGKISSRGMNILVLLNIDFVHIELHIIMPEMVFLYSHPVRLILFLNMLLL